jgi:hypothetical protein
MVGALPDCAAAGAAATRTIQSAARQKRIMASPESAPDRDHIDRRPILALLTHGHLEDTPLYYKVIPVSGTFAG